MGRMFVLALLKVTRPWPQRCSFSKALMTICGSNGAIEECQNLHYLDLSH